MFTILLFGLNYGSRESFLYPSLGNTPLMVPYSRSYEVECLGSQDPYVGGTGLGDASLFRFGSMEVSLPVSVIKVSCVYIFIESFQGNYTIKD